MKTKLYAKKTLSVFMAVMMLMTAWVFVPGEHNHASAVSANSVAATNNAAIATVVGPTEVGNYVYGKYEHDDSWVTANYYSQIYNRLLYAPTVYQSSPSASLTSQKLSDNNAVSLYWYNPTTTMVYDGGKNIPSVGVMINTDANNNCRVRTYSVYPYSGATGLSLAGNWHGIDGRLNFTYAHFNAVVNGNANGRNINCATADGSINSTYCWTTESNAETFYTNVLRFTGTMSDTEYLRTLTPTFRWRGNQRSQGTGTVYDRDLTTNNPIYIINIVPWSNAIAKGLEVFSEINTNPAKYTTASVAKYVQLANALLAANPNNYINSSVNNVTGWESAARNAVNAWNTWYNAGGLEVQKYTLTFDKAIGNDVTYTYNYGTSINCYNLAPENNLTQGDDNGHQTYAWDITNMGITSLVDDVIIVEKPDRKVAHNYSDWTQNANNHTRTCADCGYVHTQDHIKGTGYETKAETCTEDGVMTYDCSVCGKKAIATSVINNISGHDFSGTIVENVTGENGNHWRKCSRCDVYGWAGVENACENHNWDKTANGTVDSLDAVESKPSTCKEAGYEKYQCKVCNATFTKTLDLAAHTVTKTNAKDVANICGGDGNVAFWSCSVCNRVWKDEALTDEVTDLTDADNDNIPDVLETKGPEHKFNGAYASISGGADGKHHRQCERFTQCQTYGPEESHNYGDPVVTPATCTATGKEVYTCEDCKQTYTVTLEKIAHTLTKIDAVEPECGKAGNNEYYQCGVCKAYFKDAVGTIATTVAAETLPALVHTWTEHHDYDTEVSKATCQKKAVYNNHCDYCKVQMTGATHEYGEVDLVNGHKFDGDIKKNSDGTHSYKCTVEGCPEYGKATECEYKVIKDVASTCKTYGYTTYECEVCHNGYSTEKTELDFTNHEGGTEVRGKLDAMCNSNGYTGDTHCLGCGTKLETGTSIKADPTVHPHENMKDYDGEEATCQTAGFKAYRYCDQCGTYEIEKEAIAKKDHKFTTYTPNDNGTHTAICDTCDAAVAEPATDTQGCQGGTANCVDKKVCTVCNGAYGEVDSANHKTVVTVKKQDSTCQTVGYEAYQRCEACAEEGEEVIIGTKTPIEKKPHVYGAWTSNGDNTHTRTCTTCDAAVATPDKQTADCSGGIANCLEKAKCAECKAEYGEVDPENHKTTANTLKGVIAATCTAPGYTGDYHYNCCDEVKQYGTETEMLEHSYTIEVEGSRVDATCIAEGKVTYKCSTCPEDAEAATKDEVLPVNSKNHASDEEITVGAYPATCTTEGFTGNVYHACCYNPEEGADNSKALIKKGEKIKANGQHILGAGVPEYMLELDEDGEAIIIEEKDDEGKVISKSLKLKAEEPDYADVTDEDGNVTEKGKVSYRHDDGKWYHAQICDECGLVVYTACYTYEHTYNCVETDICEICSGLCSLTDSNKHKAALVLVEGTAATCIAEGVKDYYNCADCGKNYLDAAGKTIIDITVDKDKDGIADVLEIAKTAHTIDWSNGKVVKEPTCGVNGETEYSCKVDGCTYTITRADIPSDGVHEWDTEYTRVDEPTCCKNGYEAILCSVCESVKPNSYVTIPATGEHNYDKDKDGDVDKDDAVVTPGENCQKPGTLTYTCQNEGCTNTKTEIDESGVSAHQWSDWVTIGGDCSSGVVQERECTVCHTKEQQTITTDTHNLTVKVRVEPTPEKDGYVIYECKNCGYVSDPEVLEYEGAETEEHLINEEEYTIVKQATCVNGEIRAYICLRCGDKVEKEIGEPLEHVWLEQAEEKATCAKDGHSAYYRCVRCLAEYGEGKEIYPATGHADNDGDGKCDSCNSAFYEDGEGGSKTCNCICHKEGWLMQLIYKIVRFFWKLFRIGNSCDCGAVHY